MRVLVVGSGGREHALVDKLRRDEPRAELLAAPGNPGIARLATCLPVAADDVEGLAGLAEDRGVDLVVVGPEVPLAAGLADALATRRIPVFGPSRQAARIEASKAFAKELMREAGVPTASFEVFRDAVAARRHVREVGAPVVVKASGLAAGKGALVCGTEEEALAAVEEIMVERRFGGAGDRVVVEAFLEGVELSVFFLADGARAVPLVTSRDYKRVGEGDRGPNTGGMGAYAPAGDPRRPDGGSPEARAEIVAEVERLIARPVLEALAERGTPYRGFLYAGLMLTDDGPQVVEFNCRLGDPEAQVVLPLTRASVLEPMAAVARGEGLGDWSPGEPDGAALITILTSEGYPGSYEKGHPIHIPDHLEDEDVRVYQAGTALRDGELVTAGGRVLGVVGLGPDLETAAERSRAAVARIEFRGVQWRRDIGWHERAREHA